MLFRTFFVQLSILTICMIVVLLLFNSQDIFAVHQLFSWISLFTFILFCFLSYLMQSKALESSNKSLFGNVFLLSIFFKLMICALLVIGYALIAKPTDKYFIIPFFVIYLFYTVFEVYYVQKLAKS